MPDIADEADSLQEAERELAMRSRKRDVLPATGQCYYCDSDVAHPKLFCDNECADGWQGLEKAARLAGRLPWRQ